MKFVYIVMIRFSARGTLFTQTSIKVRRLTGGLFIYLFIFFFWETTEWAKQSSSDHNLSPYQLWRSEAQGINEGWSMGILGDRMFLSLL